MKQFQTNFPYYTNKSTEDVLKELETDSATGLNPTQVAQRRAVYGYNSLSSREKSIFWRLLHQFTSPFIYLLLGAALLYFFFENKSEAIVIICIVLFNGLIGFYQEYKADKAVKFLKKYLLSYARVLRTGQEIKILQNELVPGDIVLLYPGDSIPADVRLIEAENLTIDESLVTGESMPLHKTNKTLEPVQEIFKAENIGFAGTIIATGKAKGVVFAIGDTSSLGKVATLTANAEHISSFEKIIAQFSSLIVRMMAISIGVIFVVNLLVKRGNVNILELVLFAAALAVSVVPEALPIVTTYALSRGALHLARQKTVVKRLSAIEELGSIEILCCDKTGTLTENAMKVKAIYGKDDRAVVLSAALAGTFTGKNAAALRGFDKALFNTLTNEEKKKIINAERIFEFPFDSYRRSNATLIKQDDQEKLIMYGSVDVVMARCQSLSQPEQEKILQWVQGEGYKGYRLIAVAQKIVAHVSKQSYEGLDQTNDFEFVGALAFEDPLKKTAQAALAKAEQYGIQCKILSGDAPEVCAAIALQVGLIKQKEDVITGAQFSEKSEQEQREIVRKHHVFSRVSPEQKYQIIKLLQEENEVGYLGDGINDAPALKQAGVALAVYDAADIAREAADIILLEKSLMVIINGIVEGRKIFVNTFKFLRTNLSTNFGNFYALAIISLFIDKLPMLPAQILLVNILSDFPLLSLATDNVKTDQLKHPVHHDVKSMFVLATILGVISTIFDFIFFGLFFRMPIGILRTGWFVESILTELAFIFSIRSSKAFFKGGMPGLLLICLAIGSAVASIIIPQTEFGKVFFQFVPLSVSSFMLIIFLVTLYFITTDIVKVLYFRFMHNQKKRKV